MREQERYWECVRAGKADEYHGIAVHRRHLSYWEIYVLKRHLAYDPELDRCAKLNELRDEYVAAKVAALDETVAGEPEDLPISSAASSYFASEWGG
jgi:hypothetical protein